jgi:hypothetical protein
MYFQARSNNYTLDDEDGRNKRTIPIPVIAPNIAPSRLPMKATATNNPPK